MNPTRAWLLLLALSGGSTLTAVFGLPGPFRVIAVMLLAGAKARLILSAYLGLGAAPRWLHRFDLGLGFVLVLLTGLALA